MLQMYPGELFILIIFDFLLAFVVGLVIGREGGKK